MHAMLGGECNIWLVVGLLVLTLGLGAALLTAVRGGAAGTRRAR